MIVQSQFCASPDRPWRVVHGDTRGLSNVSSPVREGGPAIRVHVSPGQCAGTDCENDRERAELEDTFRPKSGEEVWYAFSVFVPDDFKDVFPTKTTISQWKDRGPPPAQINLDAGHGRIRQYNGRKDVAEIDHMRGRWTDFLINANWTDDGGYLHVWVDGDHRYGFVGPTFRADHDFGPPFRLGVYRSFLSRYMAVNGVDEVPAQTLFFDAYRCGQSRQDVEHRD